MVCGECVPAVAMMPVQSGTLALVREGVQESGCITSMRKVLQGVLIGQSTEYSGLSY